MTIRTPWGVTYDNHPVLKHSKTDVPPFTIVSTQIFDLEVRLFKYELRILEIEPARSKRMLALDRIVYDCHDVKVTTNTYPVKSTISCR